MTYEEIPGWFVQVPKEIDSKKEYGRGNRQRKQVNYSDDLTDEQFLKMCQQDEEEEPEDVGSSNLLVVPKRGRGRKPKSKNQDDYHGSANEYNPPIASNY